MIAFEMVYYFCFSWGRNLDILKKVFKNQLQMAKRVIDLVHLQVISNFSANIANLLEP